MHTTTQTKERKPVSLKDAPKDCVKLIWIERIQKWHRPENNPVSKAYWEWYMDIDIVLHQLYQIGSVWVKFIGIGETIN